MSDLSTVIKMMALTAVEGEKPVAMAAGTVESVNPLRIRRSDSEQALPESALIVCESLREYVAQVQGGEGGTVVVRKGLKVGDKVLMLRVRKGQAYIVLSRL